MITENPATGSARDPLAFLAPLVSTLITLPMGFLALFYAGMSPMQCDSCGTQASDRFDASFGEAFPVFLVGLAVVLALLLTAWGLPWEQRNRGKRALFALAAPAMVVFDVIVFYAFVDWP
ncbi:hypothetical protein ACGFX2_18380 [Streptomyces goshikiensis]|uniref:hypothetical protein n=1 Tax=Streptomyces goshikiensis TaxID=1942 RepID=UPI003713D13F